jgi:hypothetical protein
MSKDKRILAVIIGATLLVVVGLAVYANQQAQVEDQSPTESDAPARSIDQPTDQPDEQQPDQDPDTPVEQPVDDGPSDDGPELTQASCEEAGGTWNACGSACRGQEEGACIQVCVEMCECQSNNQCPDGFECGDYIDGTGICKPESLPVSK